VTVSTIFHVAENFPRRKGNTLSLSRRRGGGGGTVLLKVRNKSQPSTDRERERRKRGGVWNQQEAERDQAADKKARGK